MNEPDIAHRRMHSLRLSGPPLGSTEEVVRWLGAVQSQDYGVAKWSLGQRMAVGSEAAIDRAYADGTILRTHMLRPTWHFVLPEDIRWIQELTGPRVHATNAHYYRQHELDDATLRKTDALLARKLQGGLRRTRPQLQSMLAEEGVTAVGPRLAYILMHAELNGVISSGGLDGKQHTYALLDERSPTGTNRRRTRDEALAELTLRYFNSHGPASAKDFHWWSSLPLAEIRQGLGLAGSRLEQEKVDGATYWFAPDPSPRPNPASPTAHLLQAFDEYTVGYTETKYVLDVSGAARSLPADAAMPNNVVILDSQVVGRWKRTLTKSEVVIDVVLHGSLDNAQMHALQAAADHHGEFLGLTARLVVADD